MVGCYIFFKYILQKQLRNQSDLRDIYQSYTFGIVKNNSSEIFDNSVEQILAFITREGKSSIGLIGTDTSSETQKVFEEMALKLKNEKVEVSCACGIDEISKMLKECKNINHVVLIEKKNVSTYEDIEREVEMCEKCHVQIIGNIVIDKE